MSTPAIGEATARTRRHGFSSSATGPRPRSARRKPSSPPVSRTPSPLYADDGGDSCYAPDAGRAIALLMTADTLQQTGSGDNPYLDTTRLTHDTGFAPTVDVAAAVADYISWRAGNPR